MRTDGNGGNYKGSRLIGPAAAVLLLACSAQGQPAGGIVKSFSVGADQTVKYPNSAPPTPYLVDLPDEHTTFMPLAAGGYLVFGASKLTGGTGGAVVLETSDLKTFTFATSRGYGLQVMAPPIAIDQCNPSYTTEFDGNYAAPGSVLQDPTLPPGNLIMVYEAENHCPGGVNQQPYYATVGFARSSDNGKTWPQPVNGPSGGPARYPILQSSDQQPTVPHPAMGNAIPSGFVDKSVDGNYYLYVSYDYHEATLQQGDGLIRVARAKLGQPGPLTFTKWYNGSFSQPGIGGLDSGVTPSSGCGAFYGGQAHSEISFNDDLGLYLMVFVCVNGSVTPRTGGWYYSTATSLDQQNWTAPQLIQGSQYTVTTPCNAAGTSGGQFDGWYPSFMSPGAAQGHTKLTGSAFFLNGCDTGARQFMSRTFTITTNCSFSLNLTGQAFSSNGGTGTINVTATPGCPWVLSNLPSWITLTSPASGTGNGTVTFQVAGNAGADQTVTLSLGGQTFTVEQQAALLPGLTSVGSLAHVVSAGTWDSRLTAVNLGTSASIARFTFAADSGALLPLPFTFPQTGAGPLLAATLDRTLNPNAQVILDTTGPSTSPTLQGWGQLSTNGSVSGFGIFTNSFNGWNAVVPLETRNAASYTLAFDNTAPLATGLAIANLTPIGAAVNLIIRDDTGAQIQTGVISLVPLGHISFMLNTQYPLTAGKRGTIEFDTPPGGQISVLGLRANGPTALTTLPVLANVGTAGGSIAHVAYNGGFTSTFYIVNTGTTTAQFTLNFFDENGNALSVPLAFPQTGTNTTTASLSQPLAAGAMLVVQTLAQDGAAAVVGSAQLTTTGNVSGFEIFRWLTYQQEASVPLETRSPGSFVLVFDNTNHLTTGVAVANSTNTTGYVSVNLRDDSGNLIFTTPIVLPPFGHTSFLMPVSYAATGNLRGMAEFVVPVAGQISVIGLRAGPNGVLTTIPVLAK